MTRNARFLAVGAVLASVLLFAGPAGAQQVVGHLALLPPEAGLNPIGVDAVVVDPLNSDVFALSGRGVTVMRRGAPPGFVNVALGPKTLSNPVDCVFDPLGRRALVADAGLRAVVVVDGATGAVLARVPLGFSPSKLAFDPVQRVVFAIASSGAIGAVDASTLNLLRTGAIPGPASWARVNSANGQLFVTSNAQGLLYRLDRYLSLLATIPTGARSSRLVINGANNRVYVVREDGNVAVVDALSNAVVSTIPVPGAQRIALHAASGNVFVVGDSPDLTRIDAAGGTATVAVAASPAAVTVIGLDLDATGDRLFVGDLVRLSNGRVSVFDISGSTPVRVGGGLTGQTGATNLAWSPVTQRVYVPNTLTTTVTEFNPQSMTGTAIGIGVSIEAGVMNDAAGVGFVLDGSRNGATAVDLSVPSAIGTTPVGALPFRADIVASRNEVYVVNQNGRSISVLDAMNGTLQRTVPGLPNDVTGGIAFDRSVGGRVKGYLSNPSLSATLPAPDYLQSYLPATGDLLTPMNGNCFTTPCIVPIALGVNELTHRLYTSAVVAGVSIEPRLVIYDTTNDQYVTDVAYPNPGVLPSLFLQVDEATNQVYLPVVTASGSRVVVVQDGASPQASDIVTAGTPQAFALRSGSLFVAEPDAGVVEEVSTATNLVINTLPTGGAPTAVHAQAGNAIVWVANDGLAPPAVQAFSGSGLVTLRDLGFFGFQKAFIGRSAGRLLFANNLHGSVAVLDPQIQVADLQITPGPLPGGTVGDPYPVTQLLQTNGVGPFTWEITSGQLPPGLLMDPATGVITGTPTAEGAWSFMVRLTDRGGQPPVPQDMEDFQIQVLDVRFLTLALPPAIACQPYSVTLLGAGGVPPYTFSATGLPAWTMLDSQTGVLSGTPTAPASCPPNVDLTITDSMGRSETVTMCLEVLVSGPPPPIGNTLRAVKQAPSVDLSWQYPLPVAGANVYRSGDEGQSWARIPAGGPLPPSSTNNAYTDAGAVSGPPNLYWYVVRTVDLCGVESTE